MALRKKTSDVWNHFTFAGKTQVNCNICNKILPYSGNTTNLRSHLDRKHWSVVHRPSVQVSNDSVTVSTSRYTSSHVSMKSDFPSLPSLPSTQLSDQKDQVTVQITSKQLEQTTVPSLFNKQKPFTLNSSQATTISQGIAEYIVTDMKPAINYS
ncbi:uncharacterized protein LOC132740131 [Ruditapes philippinarum]|uniref:uncharacterized protein LOC132740131 n=1 Tax=Ruditapes philippinarum TaxID=129788 RepID=UPI00295B4742|nr:uncharacterized protein LOC132740131 [Ruditapes philippinarum]